MGIRSQGIKYRLGAGGCGTVGTVQGNLLSLKGTGSQGNQIADIAVSSCGKVHGSSDFITGSQGYFLGFSVQISLNLRNKIIGNLFSIFIDDLKTIIIERIMGGGNHDSAGKIFRTNNIAYGRRGGDMHQIRVSPCSGNSCRKCILKHIAGASGILTDNNTAFLCAFVRKIIGQELSHLKGGIRCQIHVSLSTITVCSKIFSHLFSLTFFAN